MPLSLQRLASPRIQRHSSSLYHTTGNIFTVNCKFVRNKCELEILTLKSTAVLFNSSYVLLLSM